MNICQGDGSLIKEFPKQEDHEAGTDDRKDDTGDPAAADAEKIADQTADKAADDTENGIHDKSVVLGFHDLAGNKTDNRTDHNFNNQLDEHRNNLRFV